MMCSIKYLVMLDKFLKSLGGQLNLIGYMIDNTGELLEHDSEELRTLREGTLRTNMLSG